MPYVLGNAFILARNIRYFYNRVAANHNFVAYFFNFGRDGGDRAETENDYYGYDGSYDDGNPYPGHEYYDDTQADDGTKGDAAVAEAPKAESDAQTATADSQPVKPKVDPYAIKITVSTDADRNKKGAKA